MNRAIILDSTPLALLARVPGSAPADACKAWLARHLAARARVVIPEIIDYEVRRELLRLKLTASLARLDAIRRHRDVQFLPIAAGVLDVAASLWAQARQRGRPTADPHALDVDVILAAQALSLALPPSDFVVATSNPPGHQSQFVPVEVWEKI